MSMKKRNRFSIRPVSRVFIIGLAMMLALFAGISCYYSVSFKLRSTLMQWDNTLNTLYDAYYDKVYSFSDVYEPVFRQYPEQTVLQKYFGRTGSQLPDAVEHTELANILNLMIGQDNDIDWVALYNPEANRNYFLRRGHNQLSVLPDSFPYKAEGNPKKLQLLGMQIWMDLNEKTYTSFCIQGGAIPANMDGYILVGYSLNSMARVLDRADLKAGVDFLITAGDQVVFDSSGARYGERISNEWMQQTGLVQKDQEGKRWVTGIIRNEGRKFACAYLSPWETVAVQILSDTPLLLGLLLAFAGMALLLYFAASRRIFTRVNSIGQGLAELGQNKLDYRLASSPAGDEFDQISESINNMAELLQETVNKEYELRLNQMHLQLTQIQARFNPHFLYNTLEMIRGRLFESGDLESADYIEKLARIFRNLTDAKAVVKLRDEISFCSLYVALLQLRTSDDVKVSYDVAPELLECGVISNLIQPAIENYFVHALVDEMESNELEIICQPSGEAEMRIIVSDNGMGITRERMTEVNRQLAYPGLDTPNYGLMSIAKRIKLFYGDQYGVHLEMNDEAGMRVVINIPRMSMQEHEAKVMPIK